MSIIFLARSGGSFAKEIAVDGAQMIASNDGEPRLLRTDGEFHYFLLDGIGDELGFVMDVQFPH